MNLINLLMGFCLCSVMVGGSLKWYVFIKYENKRKEQLALNQEFQALTYQFIVQDLQQGGYRGVRSRDQSYPIYRQYCDYTEAYRYFRFDQVVFGFTVSPGKCLGRMPKAACERLPDNTEVLIVYNVPRGITKLAKSMSQTDSPLTLLYGQAIQENSLVLIADHEQSELFIASKCDGQTVQHKKILGKNNSSHLSKLYSETAEVTELQTVAYYLAIPERYQDKYRSSSEGEKIYALYRDDFLQPAQELMFGVRSLQFSYGIPTKEENKSEMSNSLQYLKANEIKDWATVKSVAVQLVTETKKPWKTVVHLRNAMKH